MTAPAASRIRSHMVSFNASCPTSGSSDRAAHGLQISLRACSKKIFEGVFQNFPDRADRQGETKNRNGNKNRAQLQRHRICLVQRIDQYEAQAGQQYSGKEMQQRIPILKSIKKVDHVSQDDSAERKHNINDLKGAWYFNLKKFSDEYRKDQEQQHEKTGDRVKDHSAYLRRLFGNCRKNQGRDK